MKGADNASPFRTPYSHRLSRPGFPGRLGVEDNLGNNAGVRRPSSSKIVRRVVFVVQRAISTDDVTRTQYDDADVRPQRSILQHRGSAHPPA